MASAFGLTLPQRGVLFGVMTYREMLDLAVQAEDCDLFPSVWVGDSLTAKPRPEALGLLGALAACTERLRLGVGCMASFPVREYWLDIGRPEQLEKAGKDYPTVFRDADPSKEPSA